MCVYRMCITKCTLTHTNRCTVRETYVHEYDTVLAQHRFRSYDGDMLSEETDLRSGRAAYEGDPHAEVCNKPGEYRVNDMNEY